MKIRTGFVSNSSSSSFIVLLPPKKIKNNSKLFKRLISKKTIWEYACVRDEYENLVDYLKEYIIATFEVSSNAGTIELADTDKAVKILNEN